MEKHHKGMMIINDIEAILGAIFCNVLAQITLKLASKGNKLVAGNNNEDWFMSFFSPWILAALCAYGASFILTAVAYRRNPLNILSPTMAGAIITLTVLAGHFVFKEPLALRQIIGFALITTGIVLSTV